MCILSLALSNNFGQSYLAQDVQMISNDMCGYWKKSAHTALSAQGVIVGFLPFCETSSSHIALLGAGPFILPGAEVEAALGKRFEGGFWEDFWTFCFTAMQVSVLAELLCFGMVFDLILFRLQGQGGAFRRCIFGVFSTMLKQHGPKWFHIAFNTAPKSPKLAPRWHQRGHKIAALDPKWNQHSSQKPT